MLNISSQPSLHNKIPLTNFESGRRVTNKNYYKTFGRLSLGSLVVVIIILFLPWTQNISGRGYVTTLKPNQRPQTIQSPIPGRIEAWFVQEGDRVLKGDTILRISEIKSEYFDDRLLERTASQIEAKALSVVAYQDKFSALTGQIAALKDERIFKLRQAENKLLQAGLKVQSDSIDLEAAKTNRRIAQTRYERVIALQKDGLKATKDVEEKKMKLQETQAKYISQTNKLLESKNRMTNARIELSRIQATYADKVAKAQSERHATQSSRYNAQVEVSKLENSYANYTKRRQLQFVTAPQDGYINRALKGGVGEAFKAGEGLVTIMPAHYDLAVETYVRPIDLPLVHIDEHVRVQFDGWPAIVFSGWESVSYGTYGAKVVAIETLISANGMYRILLVPDEQDHAWPTGIRVGSGAKTIALLNDVPIWFEFWRQVNGFPPNFYKPNPAETGAKK